MKKNPNLILVKDMIQNKIHNHLECNYHLNNKKALFYNIKYYAEALNDDLANYIPLTFHITTDKDAEFLKF